MLDIQGYAAAQVVGRDPATNIELLKVERETGAPVQLADVVPQFGNLALTIGASEGGATTAFDIVSWSGPAWRSMRGSTIDYRIVLDIALRRSAGGGLALDAAGRVLRMTVLGTSGKPLVIPTSKALRAH